MKLQYLVTGTLCGLLGLLIGYVAGNDVRENDLNSKADLMSVVMSQMEFQLKALEGDSIYGNSEFENFVLDSLLLGIAHINNLSVCFSEIGDKNSLIIRKSVSKINMLKRTHAGSKISYSTSRFEC